LNKYASHHNVGTRVSLASNKNIAIPVIWEMFEILGAEHGQNIFRVHLRFNSPRRLTSFFLYIKSHFNIINKMALYTVLCFIKFDLINNGFGIIHEDDISIQLVRVIIIIQRMMLLRMQNNSCSRSDAHTSSEDIIIVEVLQIGMTQSEAVVIKTPEIDTVELVNKEIVQLPLV